MGLGMRAGSKHFTRAGPAVPCEGHLAEKYKVYPPAKCLLESAFSTQRGQRHLTAILG